MLGYDTETDERLPQLQEYLQKLINRSDMRASILFRKFIGIQDHLASSLRNELQLLGSVHLEHYEAVDCRFKNGLIYIVSRQPASSSYYDYVSWLILTVVVWTKSNISWSNSMFSCGAIRWRRYHFRQNLGLQFRLRSYMLRIWSIAAKSWFIKWCRRLWSKLKWCQRHDYEKLDNKISQNSRIEHYWVASNWATTLGSHAS